MPFRFDLDTYCQRLGLKDLPIPTEQSLRDIHLGQLFSIPFENIDIFSGLTTPISLEAESMSHKLLDSHRGGYCFELNSLLKLALESIGLSTSTMLARRLYQRPQPGPLTHMLLKAKVGSRSFLCDVGFGGLAFRSPIPFEVERVDHQFNESFKIRKDASYGFVLQKLEAEEGWQDLYCFTGQDALPGDLEMSHFFTSQHPTSNFKKKLMIVLPSETGTISLSDLNLKRNQNSETLQEQIIVESVPGLLFEIFKIQLNLELQNRLIKSLSDSQLKTSP